MRLPFRVEFTNTHIITLDRRYNPESTFRSITLIQIFTVPLDGSSVQEGKPVLCLAHQCFLDSRLLNVRVLKSRVDPITGATCITLVDHGSSLSHFNIMCYDFMLPKYSSLDSVSEMTVVDRPVINVQIEGDYIESSLYVDVCDDMQLRGFYCARSKVKSVVPNETRHDKKWEGSRSGKHKGRSVSVYQHRYVMKFTIDMRQDPWAVVRGQMAPVEWHDAVAPRAAPTWGKNIVFDGLGGRLCYVDPACKDRIVVVGIE